MSTNNVLPQLSMLTPEQIEQVHRSALDLLANLGVRVDSPSVCQLLAEKIGASQLDGSRVRFPAEVVEWALRSAPAKIEIYDRLGRPAFQLGDGRMHYGVGVTALYYQDPATDRLSPFTRANMRDLTRLAGQFKHYEVVSTLGVVQDVAPQLSDLVGNLEMLANTTRPLVLLVSDENNFPPVLDMFEQLSGDLGQKPYVLPYFNPVSPLVLNTGTVEKMVEAIRRGLPIIFSNYSMAGASTPITPAGTLTLLMAELLAGLTVSQIIKPGAPILLGMLPVYFDMREMITFYDPQSILLNLACSEMLAHYNLPHCGSSGSGTGWGADMIAADTYWMNTLTFSLARGGLAPFVGDTLTSKAISPKTLVYVHEIIEQSQRFAAGFQLDAANSVLDEIRKVGPGGSFLSAPSTRQRYRSGYYTSQVFPRMSMEKWLSSGEPSAAQVLRDQTLKQMAASSAPDDYDTLIEKGEQFIATLK